MGTPLYMAPEMVKDEKYDLSVDAWALGVVIYSLCSEGFQMPFRGTN